MSLALRWLEPPERIIAPAIGESNAPALPPILLLLLLLLVLDLAL